MVMSSSYVVENDEKFKSAIEDAAAKVGNLSFAYKEIARDWFKSNKSIFSLKGDGLYPPLSETYKERKTKQYGDKPIMVRSGRLKNSLSGKPNKDSILHVGKRTLVMGTKVPYLVYHESDDDRFVIPLRKVLFIGPEAPSSAPSDVTGRLSRFLKILETEVQRQLDK